MIWLLLIAGGVGYWVWKKGVLPSIGPADIGAGVAVIAGLKMLAQGKPLLAAIALGGAAWWFYNRSARAATIGVEEARRLLELPADADKEAIQAAHRRLIARVHPDAGGSAELSAKVNAARDALLAELRRRS
jgi:hypothetical protein